MKKILLFALLSAMVESCAPKFSSTINTKQPPLAQTDYVLVLQREDQFTNDGIEIGTISAGDNGFSVNCSYNEVLARLKDLARQNGANLIKITEQIDPNAWSTCVRLTAKIYKVPNFRLHEKQIEWSANRRLTWDDFKGMPKTMSNTNSAAQTYCGFSFETNRVTAFKKVKIFTKNSFDCYLSWVRPDQMTRLDLLEHEQVHFDLSEVYARRLRKNLVEMNLTLNNLTTGADVVFKAVSKEYLERQELYEAETRYGLDKEVQHMWTKEVVNEIEELSSWTE